MARVRTNLTGDEKAELAFYRGVYHVRELMLKKAQIINEIVALDKEIAKYVSDVKPYSSWDRIGEMLNMSGGQAKKYFEPLMPKAEEEK